MEASNTLGLLKLNVAMPEDPSRARVSLIPGTTFSSRPLTNWICAAERDVEKRDVKRVEVGVKASVDDATSADARTKIDLIVVL